MGGRAPRIPAFGWPQKKSPGAGLKLRAGKLLHLCVTPRGCLSTCPPSGARLIIHAGLVPNLSATPHTAHRLLPGCNPMIISSWPLKGQRNPWALEGPNKGGLGAEPPVTPRRGRRRPPRQGPPVGARPLGHNTLQTNSWPLKGQRITLPPDGGNIYIGPFPPFGGKGSGYPVFHATPPKYGPSGPNIWGLFAV